MQQCHDDKEANQATAHLQIELSSHLSRITCWNGVRKNGLDNRLCCCVDAPKGARSTDRHQLCVCLKVQPAHRLLANVYCTQEGHTAPCNSAVSYWAAFGQQHRTCKLHAGALICHLKRSQFDAHMHSYRSNTHENTLDIHCRGAGCVWLCGGVTMR